MGHTWATIKRRDSCIRRPLLGRLLNHIEVSCLWLRQVTYWWSIAAICSKGAFSQGVSTPGEPFGWVVACRKSVARDPIPCEGLAQADTITQPPLLLLVFPIRFTVLCSPWTINSQKPFPSRGRITVVNQWSVIMVVASGLLPYVI